MNAQMLAMDVREEVLAGNIDVEVADMGGGRRRVALSGKTYAYKDFIRDKLHMDWDRDERRWYVEVDGSHFWPTDRRRMIGDARAMECVDHIVAGETYGWEG